MKLWIPGLEQYLKVLFAFSITVEKNLAIRE
jgi:hypothetical protein